MNEWLSENLPVVIAVLLHAAATIRWSTTVNNSLTNIANSLQRIDKELEKRDVSINSIGTKLDNIRERVIILEHNGKSKGD